MHSGIHISQTDERPMYLQITEQIRQRIAAGDWAPRKELPSIRALAVDLRVSVITVKRAYLDLENEGVIVTRHGKGSFVAEAQDLAARMHDDKLAAHLEAAAEMAQLLGITPEDLATRLKQVTRKREKK
jgi:GntR family transcriptional regulator